MRRPAGRRAGGATRGQALVEFSLVLIPFLFLLMGVVDLGRGIYTNNAVAEAAREVARVTSVHPCTGSPCTLGNGTETQGTIATQRTLVPRMSDPAAIVAIDCVNVADTVLNNTDCRPGSFVRVKVSVPFDVMTPLLNLGGTMTLASTSHVQIP